MKWGDIENKRLILMKGFLFLFLGTMSGSMLLYEHLSFKNMCLLSICVWSFCRFYYFAFYVIEKYVDETYKFTGLFSLVKYFLKRS